MARQEVHPSRRYVYGFLRVAICPWRVHRAKHQGNLQSVAMCLPALRCSQGRPLPCAGANLDWRGALAVNFIPWSLWERFSTPVSKRWLRRLIAKARPRSVAFTPNAALICSSVSLNFSGIKVVTQFPGGTSFRPQPTRTSSCSTCE